MHRRSLVTTPWITMMARIMTMMMTTATSMHKVDDKSAYQQKCVALIRHVFMSREVMVGVGVLLFVGKSLLRVGALLVGMVGGGAVCGWWLMMHSTHCRAFDVLCITGMWAGTVQSICWVALSLHGAHVHYMIISTYICMIMSCACYIHTTTCSMYINPSINPHNLNTHTLYTHTPTPTHPPTHTHTHTLYMHRADPGTPGGGSNMHGRKGEDLLIAVPVGTIVRTRDAAPDDPPLAELVKPGVHPLTFTYIHTPAHTYTCTHTPSTHTPRHLHIPTHTPTPPLPPPHPGEKALLVNGGRGGRGNASFKTARNTAPAIAERGEEGEEAWVDLELKVVADVGIVGVPNAGKSTLLSVVCAVCLYVGAWFCMGFCMFAWGVVCVCVHGFAWVFVCM